MRANAEHRGVNREILAFYKVYDEKGRLGEHSGQLEFHRTKEIISRYLGEKRVVILDVGGGPGRYAYWLASLGHAVHLVDPVPGHIRQSRSTATRRGQRLRSAEVGDARLLRFGDKTADRVLLLGPLYHLVERSDRMAALREAYRTLKPGGLLFAAAISRFASSFDGLLRGFVRDPSFFRIVQHDLENGQHRNPKKNPQYFTTAFFHHPDELRREIQQAGFKTPEIHGLEGPGWLLADFEKYWGHPKLRSRLLTIVRSLETEPTLLGLSAHLLAVARR
jgi:ubiquinone/menaquinone biosynthesis C-methylase UbiE